MAFDASQLFPSKSRIASATHNCRRSSWRDARFARTLLLALLACAWPTPPAMADDSDGDFFGLPVPDLTFERRGDPDTWLKPTMRWDTVFFVESDAWAGSSKQILGHRATGWNEIGVVPGVDGQMSLGDWGTLDGRLSGVFTTTQIHIDAAGSNQNSLGQITSPAKITLEDFYVRWSSGELVSSLGKDAIQLSIGSQKYQLGPAAKDNLGAGFLIYNGGTDGGKRGGYWLGLRNAFQLAGIARVKTGNFLGEAVYLTPNQLGEDFTDTSLAGVNLEYDFGPCLDRDFAKLGVSYFNVYESPNPRRDGLNVVDVRVDVAPLHSLPGLRFTGEMVKENNGRQNDSWGAWGELGYDFGANEVPYSPYLSYRIVHFTGDDQIGDNDSFDPLFYGFSDWNYWYLGEIVGEWVAGNANINTYILRMRANPVKSVTTQLFWLYYRLEQKVSNFIPPGGRPPANPMVGNITDKSLAHELNFTIDWQVNDHLLLSTVGSVLIPLKGAKEFFGRGETWGQWMIFSSVSF